MECNNGFAWAAKASAVPTLPRPTEEWAEQLKRVLQNIRDFGPTSRDAEFTNSGSTTVYTFRQYADQLAPFDLVARTADRTVSIGGFGSRWLDDPTSEGLLRQLHARARFVGELLQALADGPQGIAALLDVANDEYSLDWKSYDQVRRRLTWLITLGYAERQFGNRYAITDAGRAILPSLWLHDPSDSAGPVSTERLPAPGPVIGALVATLAADRKVDQGRRRGLGYFPTNTDSPLVTSMRTLTSMCLDETDIDDFIAEVQERFSIRQSSARTALGSLRAAGLLESTGRATFAATQAAREWLRSGSVIDLVRITHASTFPIGEAIKLIDDAKKAPALAMAIEARFGQGSTSALSIGRTIQLLLAGGLVREIGYARYATTPLGRALADSLPIRAERVGATDEALIAEFDEPETESADEVAVEILEAGSRSDQPRRLETAVAAAMNYLGAVAQDIGGTGNTDVLVEVGTQPGDKFVAIVDAKTSGHGVVNEGAVKLDAIEEHKQKHRATLAAIVAPGFGARLAKWAADRGIALITTDLLADLVRCHAVTPLGRDELRMLLTGGDAHEALRIALDGRGRRTDLLGRVMAVLLREAEEDDPNVASGLDLDGVYRAIRDQFQIKSDKKDLQAALDLLASPLVAGVSKIGSAFVAVEPLKIVRVRVGSLASVLTPAAKAA